MEQNNRMINKEYRELKCSLYNHLLTFLIASGLNIIFIIKIYFIHIVYKAFFYISTIIFILLLPIPIYPLVLLCKNLLISDKVKKMIKSSLIIVFIIIFFGVIINIVLFLNIFQLFTFYKECPYNYSYNDISKIFKLNYDFIEDIDYNQSSKCSDNRCLLIKKNLDNTLQYSYLCNFDSSKDFKNLKDRLSKKINNNNMIECTLFLEAEFQNKNNFNRSSEEELFIIKSYYDICSPKNNFFKCNRYEKPKQYKIDYNFSCPTFLKNIVDLIFGIISIIFNLFFPLIVSLVQYFKYKNILKLYKNINDDRASTRGSSKVITQTQKSENKNDDLGNNNEILIIVTNNVNNNKRNEINHNTNNNMNNIINNNEDILNVNKKNKNIFKETEDNLTSERKKINMMTTEDIKIGSDKNENNDIISKDKKSNDSVYFGKINFPKRINYNDA